MGPAKNREAEIAAVQQIGEDLYSRSAAETFIQADADGTLGQYDLKTAEKMTFAASLRPDIFSETMGAPPGFGDGVNPAALREDMMDKYNSAVMADVMREAYDEQESVPADMHRYRYDTMYSYANLTADDIGKMEFAAEQGDDSALAKVRERFYLG